MDNYIQISNLKKQAKKLRKNNNNFKNHSDSLNYIARQYQYKNWEQLLENTVLPINTFEEQDQKTIANILQKMIEGAYNDWCILKGIMESNNYMLISKWLSEHLMFDKTDSSDKEMWRERAIKLLEIFAYILTKETHKTNEEKLILIAELAIPENFVNIVQKHELFEDSHVSSFLKNGIVWRDHYSNLLIDPEQFSFLTMQFSVPLSDLQKTLSVFSLNESKDEFYNKMSEVNNVLLLIENKTFQTLYKSENATEYWKLLKHYSQSKNLSSQKAHENIVQQLSITPF